MVARTDIRDIVKDIEMFNSNERFKHFNIDYGRATSGNARISLNCIYNEYKILLSYDSFTKLYSIFIRDMDNTPTMIVNLMDNNYQCNERSLSKLINNNTSSFPRLISHLGHNVHGFTDIVSKTLSKI